MNELNSISSVGSSVGTIRHKTVVLVFIAVVLLTGAPRTKGQEILSPLSDSPLFSEVKANPSVTDGQAFFELFNPTNETMDMSNYKVCNSGRALSQDPTECVTLKGNLPPLSYYVICRDISFHWSCQLGSSLLLATSIFLGLFDTTNRLLDQVFLSESTSSRIDLSYIRTISAEETLSFFWTSQSSPGVGNLGGPGVTFSPSSSPSIATKSPTESPTTDPTMAPSLSSFPTFSPTVTRNPTNFPTESPKPSPQPSAATDFPSRRPIQFNTLSLAPSRSPTRTMSPSFILSLRPSGSIPTESPAPSPSPSGVDSMRPTGIFPTESPAPSPGPSGNSIVPTGINPTDSPRPSPSPSTIEGFRNTRTPTESPQPSPSPSSQ